LWQVIEIIGKENVKLNSKQVDELIELIDKEEILEVEDKIEKALQKDKEAKLAEKLQAKAAEDNPDQREPTEESSLEKVCTHWFNKYLLVDLFALFFNFNYLSSLFNKIVFPKEEVTEKPPKREERLDARREEPNEIPVAEPKVDPGAVIPPSSFEKTSTKNNSKIL